MRLSTFKSGVIDDLWVEKAIVKIERTDKCRYRFGIEEASERVIFSLWTTKKGNIDFDIYGEDVFTWLSVRMENGKIEKLNAENVQLHLENLDRGVYSLSISLGKEDWGCSIRSKGYLKTKIEENV